MAGFAKRARRTVRIQVGQLENGVGITADTIAELAARHHHAVDRDGVGDFDQTNVLGVSLGTKTHAARERDDVVPRLDPRSKRLVFGPQLLCHDDSAQGDRRRQKRHQLSHFCHSLSGPNNRWSATSAATATTWNTTIAIVTRGSATNAAAARPIPVITVHRLLRASGPLANQTTTATSRLRPATKALDSTEKSGPAPKYHQREPGRDPRPDQRLPNDLRPASVGCRRRRNRRHRPGCELGRREGRRHTGFVECGKGLIRLVLGQTGPIVPSAIRVRGGSGQVGVQPAAIVEAQILAHRLLSGLRGKAAARCSHSGFQPAAVIMRASSLRARCTWLRAVDSGIPRTCAISSNDSPLSYRSTTTVPLIGAEAGQCGLERTSEGAPLDRIGHSGCCRFVRSVTRVEVDRGRSGAAQRVDASVVGDAKQPAGQPPLGVEGRQVAESLDEGLLRQVLGKSRIARETDEQAQNRALISAQDLLEGGLGAGQGLGDEPRLRYRLEVNRDEESSSRLRSMRSRRCRLCGGRPHSPMLRWSGVDSATTEVPFELFNTHSLAGSPNRERRPHTCEQRQLAPLPVAIHVCEANPAEPSELGFDVEQLVRGILL